MGDDDVWNPDPWKDDPWADLMVTDDGIELIAAYRRGNGRCGVCGETVDLAIASGKLQPTLDHIHPQRYGGGPERANIQIAHKGCNSRKGCRISRPVTEEEQAYPFRQRRGKRSKR